MNWDDIHSQAKKTATGSLDLAPRRYMVGLVLLNKPTKGLSDSDFVWVKAHAKITAGKLRDVYVDKQPPGIRIELESQGKVIALDTLCRDLDHYGDRLIVLRVVRKKTRNLSPTQRDTQVAPQRSLTQNLPNASIDTFDHPPTWDQFAGRDDTHNVFNSELGSASPSAQSAAVTPSSRLDRSTYNGHVAADTPTAPSRTVPTTSKPVHSESPAGLHHRPPPFYSSLDIPAAQGSNHRTAVPDHLERAPAQYSSPYSRSTMPNVDRGQHQVADKVPFSNPPFAPKLENMSPRPYIHSIAQPASSSDVEAHRRYPSSPAVKSEIFSSPEPETPFDPSQVFNRGVSQEIEDVSQEMEGKLFVETTNKYINEIMNQDEPEKLERGVAKAVDVLQSLKSTFTRHSESSSDATSWVQAIEKLEDQAEREQARTVIGVVGNTGAGKSSVINALLDEERLVPTNCMRACTAVVTSISYNANDDPSSKYLAEVQFIEVADWEKELRILITEFLSEHGTLSSEAKDPNSDAGVALSKFRAVYPKISKDRLGDWTVEELINEKAVLNCLGTTKKVRSAYPNHFYSQLQQFVDSKEKSTGKKEKKDKGAHPDIEYWPLIKEVRIFTKAKALETGAVVVDLPGVHDSNAARAAVAERYMKQCTGLWIVAPITRAVDDKAAKNLLGETFKRQLKYDGNYSNVTFICSKTDDISITEATDSLDLQSEISTLEDQQQSHKSELESVNQEVSTLLNSIELCKDVMDDCDKELETWEELKDNFDDGKTVYAPPKKKRNKRKRASSSTDKRPSKRREPEDSDVEYISSEVDNSTDTSEAEEDSGNEGVEQSRSPLTSDEIKAKIEELRQSKKNARQEKAVIARQMPDLKAKTRKIKTKIAEIRGEMSALCIAGRNAYSKGAIQQDFAAGIRELDMENAEEEDEENFNPDEDQRDYDDVARSLPVFCVSSRAYQKMCGRLIKDEQVPGFKTPEETEMPQLQEHCKRLTVAVRVQICRKFLLNFVSQLTTFALWASNDGRGLNMTDADRSKQGKYLQKRLSELEKGFEQAVAVCVQRMEKELHNQIFKQFPELIEEAVRVAPQTAYKWGEKQQGGLVWSTYKAVCRRYGVYQSASAGHRDFNSDLTSTIMSKLANNWERAFQNRLPKALKEYTEATGIVLHKFHDTIEQHSHENGVGLATLSLLKGSINTYEQMLRDDILQYTETISTAQREASREFVPTVARFMEHGYTLCVNESGPGSYMRMKNHMTSHVEQHRFTMFNAASQTVEAALKAMCKSLEEMLLNNADEIFAAIRSSYLNALSGVQVSADTPSRSERNLKAEVVAFLNEVDDKFKPIAKGGEAEAKEEATTGVGNGVENETEAEGEAIAIPEAMDVDIQNTIEIGSKSPERDPPHTVADNATSTDVNTVRAQEQQQEQRNLPQMENNNHGNDDDDDDVIEVDKVLHLQKSDDGDLIGFNTAQQGNAAFSTHWTNVGWGWHKST